jgi:cobaltochelatase CobS
MEKTHKLYQRLRKALSKSFDDMRYDLRKLANEVVETDVSLASHGDALKEIQDNPSMLVDNYSGVKFTWAWIRDRLHTDALIFLCDFGGGVSGGLSASDRFENIMNCIAYPKRSRLNAKSRHGYDLGVPHTASKRIEDFKSELLSDKSTTKQGESMQEERRRSTLDLTLEELMAVFDTVMSHCVSKQVGICEESFVADVMKAFASCYEEENRLIGLQALVKSKLTEGKIPDYTNEIPCEPELDEFVQAILHTLGVEYSYDKQLVKEATTSSIGISKQQQQMVDQLMQSIGASTTIEEMFAETKQAAAHVVEKDEEIAELKKKLSKAQQVKATPAFPTAIVAKTSDATPAGETTNPDDIECEIVKQSAMDIFKSPDGKKIKAFDYEVPVLKWKKPNTDVPEIDPNYVFRGNLLADVLYCILHNQKGFLSGHTGTGKTTLIEQVCARLGYPFKRVNFDSEITRLDLVGREVLHNEGGNTVSKFIDGIIPQAVRQACVLCLDEIDFVRPDVAYVLQRALENKGFTVLEDGDRFIEPNPLFRIFATANTRGQGDETGSYQGARHQSLAFLDRFNVFTHVPYLSEDQEGGLLIRANPTLDEELAKQLVKFAQEVREAFRNGTIYMTVSVRGLLSCASMITYFMPLFENNLNYTLSFAITKSILNRCNAQDFQNISEIAQRVFDTKGGQPLKFKYED